MADTQVKNETELTSFDGDEVMYIVDDPSGTPADRKVKVAHFLPPGIFPVFAIAGVYNVNYGAVSPSNNTLTANRLCQVPIFVPRRRTYTTLVLNLGTLSASTGIRLGIYNCNQTTGQPTTLLQEGTGSPIDSSVGTGVTGTKTVTISQTLNPGWYYLACVSDGAPSIHSMNSPTNAGAPLGTALSAGTVVPLYGLFRTFTYGALPADDTAQTYTGNSAGTVMPFLGAL